MSDKLEIKYILHGTIEIEKPTDWDEMSSEVQIAYMNEIMINADKDILTEGARPEYDTSVKPMALVDEEDTECEYSIMCDSWRTYALEPGTSEDLYPCDREKRIKFEQVHYTLPTHWAGALINGDNTLEGDDLDCYEAFMEEEREGKHIGHWSIKTEASEIESSFHKYHDAEPYGVLACDCFEYVWTEVHGNRD